MSLTLSVTECMSSLDIYVSLKPEAIKILKLCVFLIVIFLCGCCTWNPTRSCGMKKQSVQYTSHFSTHSMQAMAICSRNGFICLNCGISRVLESWPFRCALSMHLCMWHCDCSTRMGCVDTFCSHLSLIYLYREDAWNVPVSLFFLNVIISLSLNDSAHNILNDVLTIIFIIMVLLEASSCAS